MDHNGAFTPGVVEDTDKDGAWRELVAADDDPDKVWFVTPHHEGCCAN